MHRSHNNIELLPYLKSEIIFPGLLFIITIGSYGAAYIYATTYYLYFGIPSYLVDFKVSLFCQSAFYLFLITIIILWGYISLIRILNKIHFLILNSLIIDVSMIIFYGCTAIYQIVKSYIKHDNLLIIKFVIFGLILILIIFGIIEIISNIKSIIGLYQSETEQVTIESKFFKISKEIDDVRKSMNKYTNKNHIKDFIKLVPLKYRKTYIKFRKNEQEAVEINRSLKNTKERIQNVKNKIIEKSKNNVITNFFILIIFFVYMYCVVIGIVALNKAIERNSFYEVEKISTDNLKYLIIAEFKENLLCRPFNIKTNEFEDQLKILKIDFNSNLKDYIINYKINNNNQK